MKAMLVLVFACVLAGRAMGQDIPVPLVDMPSQFPAGAHYGYAPPTYYVQIKGYVLQYDKMLEHKRYQSGLESATVATIRVPGLFRTGQDCMRRGRQFPEGTFFRCVPVL